MIVCPLCGSEAPSGARNCPQCGKRLSAGPFALGEQAIPVKSSIEVAAFAFYVVSCVGISFFIVPLIWAIPATIYVKNRIDRREKISLLFKLISFFSSPSSGLSSSFFGMRPSCGSRARLSLSFPFPRRNRASKASSGRPHSRGKPNEGAIETLSGGRRRNDGPVRGRRPNR